jgi:hypothetical protein
MPDLLLAPVVPATALDAPRSLISLLQIESAAIGALQIEPAAIGALQIEPATAGPLAFLGTLLVFTALYGTTLHIAARYVLGDVPVKRAFAVGAALALASLLLQRYGPGITLAVTIALDVFLISAIYRLSWRRTALVAIVHYTVTVIVGFTLYNLIALLATAPA